MDNDVNLHDDDFFDDVKETQQRFAFFGFAFLVFLILLISAIIYFFLAAGGLLPPLDFIPFVPYV